MLRWILRRHHATLTCEIDSNDRGWEVCVVPHWNVGAATIERFKTPLSAVERHADIAYRLRQAGWSVVDHLPRVAAATRRAAA